MKDSDMLSKKMFRELIRVFPEFSDWMKKDVVEIKKFLTKDSIVLDVGCGWGREIKELYPFCKKIIGIDIDPKEIRTAKKYLKGIENAELFIRNAKSTCFKKESFDVIISSGNTFGTFRKDKKAVLREMRRLIKKDGKILISVWSKKATNKRKKAYEAIGLKIRKIKDKIIFEDGLISEGFSKKELKKIFNDVGLKFKLININPVTILSIVTRYH